MHNFCADTYHDALVQHSDVGAIQTECKLLQHDAVRIRAESFQGDSDSVDNSCIDTSHDALVQASAVKASQTKCAVL